MKENDKIVFKYDGIELQYRVVQVDKRCWLSNFDAGNNGAIFNLLRIKDKLEFCEKEIGYTIVNRTADFPEVKSLEDLEKIVNALYKRITEISTPKFKVGDLVMVVKREGESSDYTCSYNDEMLQYENRIFTIGEVHKMSTSSMKSYISRLRYEEPFYYTLEGNDWNWSSGMLRKVEIIKDVIKDIITPDGVVLADIGKVNIDGVSSYMDVHTPVTIYDKATSGPSIYPEKEEPEYKLNFNVKSLNFLKHD